ncbi:GntR family transcriptional regulator [Gracilibacillus sp. YIM 98692]|uniref:GntR family transcriptional regulator n=1 Tax=Gracilibacillus sp. YIM 98692 TaxID=2663532 RepID=UPI0013D407DF|nr:GntR family transcriptional regulator [Gracilibacillus sp. YIM 98692]
MKKVKAGIDKNNPLPLYFQLKEIIKKDIENGVLKPGEPILSERELIEMYDISRTPVRQALDELVSEGLLRREHGKGTFVTGKKISQWFLENLRSFGDEMNEKGLEYRTILLSKQIVETNSILEEIFGSKYTRFYHLERLRYVKEEPYVLVTTYVPYDLAPNLLEEDLENQSLYKTLETNYELHISYALRDIEAINVNEEDAEKIGVHPASAIHLTKTVAYLSDDKPFEYSIGRYRGDLNKFSVRVPLKK